MAFDPLAFDGDAHQAPTPAAVPRAGADPATAHVPTAPPRRHDPALDSDDDFDGAMSEDDTARGATSQGGGAQAVDLTAEASPPPASTSGARGAEAPAACPSQALSACEEGDAPSNDGARAAVDDGDCNMQPGSANLRQPGSASLRQSCSGESEAHPHGCRGEGDPATDQTPAAQREAAGAAIEGGPCRDRVHCNAPPSSKSGQLPAPSSPEPERPCSPVVGDVGDISPAAAVQEPAAAEDGTRDVSLSAQAAAMPRWDQAGGGSSCIAEGASLASVATDEQARDSTDDSRAVAAGPAESGHADVPCSFETAALERSQFQPLQVTAAELRKLVRAERERARLMPFHWDKRLHKEPVGMPMLKRMHFTPMRGKPCVYTTRLRILTRRAPSAQVQPTKLLQDKSLRRCALAAPAAPLARQRRR